MTAVRPDTELQLLVNVKTTEALQTGRRSYSVPSSALLTAQEDSRVGSESQENLFIIRWFVQAKKQRRFSRDVATDIDWILNQG